MCGLIGSVGNESKSDFSNALKYLQKRGPDSVGEWSNEFIHLGHTRLAVRDTSNNGSQPMRTYDGRYILVYNGELYNEPEIKELLKEHKVYISGSSDTELLCHLFSIYGVNSIPMLQGMFAIAIYDTLENKLYLTRDPFGIKPLYIYRDDGVLHFSSEATALYILSGKSLCVSDKSLRDYEFFGHVASSETIFNGVFECGPGEVLEYDIKSSRVTINRVIDIRQYWKINEVLPANINVASSIESAIIESFRRHLISDVPVCLFLSSGLDSAVLAAVARKLGIELNCITIGVDRYRDSAFDEIPLAAQLARQFGHKHHIIYYTDKELQDLFGEFLCSMDQPSIDGFNIWLASRFATSLGFKVALSGAGADEIFNGYAHLSYIRKIFTMRSYFGYMPLKYLSRLVANYLPYKLRKALLLLAHSDSLSNMLDIFRSANMLYPDFMSSKNRDSQIWGRPIIDETDVGRFCSYYEVTNYLRFRLLRDSDWASMAHGLELRLPFIDIKFLKDVSIYFYQSNLMKKNSLFRQFSRLELPSWLFSRRKSGFNIPFIGNSGSDVDNSYVSRMSYLARIKNDYISLLFSAK